MTKFTTPFNFLAASCFPSWDFSALLFTFVHNHGWFKACLAVMRFAGVSMGSRDISLLNVLVTLRIIIIIIITYFRAAWRWSLWPSGIPNSNTPVGSSTLQRLSTWSASRCCHQRREGNHLWTSIQQQSTTTITNIERLKSADFVRFFSSPSSVYTITPKDHISAADPVRQDSPHSSRHLSHSTAVYESMGLTVVLFLKDLGGDVVGSE